jgi:hypothetical protein
MASAHRGFDRDEPESGPESRRNRQLARLRLVRGLDERQARFRFAKTDDGEYGDRSGLGKSPRRSPKRPPCTEEEFRISPW